MQPTSISNSFGSVPQPVTLGQNPLIAGVGATVRSVALPVIASATAATTGVGATPAGVNDDGSARTAAGVGATITPGPSAPPLSGGRTVHLTPAPAPGESITLTQVTAAKIDKYVTSTIGGGAIRTHDMQPLQQESGIKALQGVVNALWQLQGTGPGKVDTPGLDLSKPNPKFTIDFSRCIISYPVTVSGKVERREVSLREAMENTSQEGQALNNAMEALALEARVVVGEKGIQSETLLQQCDRNYNKSPSLRRSASEPGYQQAKAAWKSATTPEAKAAAKKEMEKFKFQSKFPIDIAATKEVLGITSGNQSDRIDALAKRLEKMQEALAHRITVKQGLIETKRKDIETKNTEIAALPPAATPPDVSALETKRAKEEEVKVLQRDLAAAQRELAALEADQESLYDVDEFALTVALAHSAPKGASAAAIDQAARNARNAAEDIYNKKYGEYKREHEDPHYSFAGKDAFPIGAGGKLPPREDASFREKTHWRAKQAGRAIFSVIVDVFGSWIVPRVPPDRSLDQPAQYAAQYAGDVGALVYNQMGNSADERLHYATYCANQNIALARQGITDHVLRSLFAAEGVADSGDFLNNLLGLIGSAMTPADRAAIKAEMDLPPPAPAAITPATTVPP